MMTVPSILVAGVQNDQREPKPGMAMPGMMMMNCPMNLQGATATVTDTPTGVTVTITTTPENVAELRRRVERMATMHSANPPSEAMMKGQMMPGTVKYEAIENGARLTLTPRDTTRLAEFRSQVRAHLEKMQKGECAMMQDMMQGMMKGMTDPKKGADGVK
jgi:hypothetical protein